MHVGAHAVHLGQQAQLHHPAADAWPHFHLAPPPADAQCDSIVQTNGHCRNACRQIYNIRQHKVCVNTTCVAQGWPTHPCLCFLLVVPEPPVFQAFVATWQHSWLHTRSDFELPRSTPHTHASAHSCTVLQTQLEHQTENLINETPCILTQRSLTC
jgi:hypothetical protein